MLAHKMRSEGQTLEVISEKTICLRFIRKVPIVEGRYLHSSEQTTSPINIRRATGCFSEISVYTNAYVSTVPMRFFRIIHQCNHTFHSRSKCSQTERCCCTSTRSGYLRDPYILATDIAKRKCVGSGRIGIVYTANMYTERIETEHLSSLFQ